MWWKPCASVKRNLKTEETNFRRRELRRCFPLFEPAVEDLRTLAVKGHACVTSADRATCLLFRLFRSGVHIAPEGFVGSATFGRGRLNLCTSPGFPAVGRATGAACCGLRAQLVGQNGGFEVCVRRHSRSASSQAHPPLGDDHCSCEPLKRGALSVKTLLRLLSQKRSLLAL